MYLVETVYPAYFADRSREYRVETRAVVLYFALTFGLALAGAGAATRAVCLGGAGLLGLYLSRRNASLYLTFVFWLWFIIPFVRRVMNFRSAWVDTDPILGASLLATLACFPQVCRSLSKSNLRGTLPFLLALAAIAYGSFATLFSSPFASAVLQTANWSAPVVLGIYVFQEYTVTKSRERLKQAFESTFNWALIVMGAYSIIQFVFVPGWDALWLNQVDNAAFGSSEPFSIRVFSMMASPVPLGVASFAGLVLLIGQTGWRSVSATLGGYISLALCIVRSAWGLWAIGTLIVLFSRRKNFGRFVLVTCGFLTLLAMSTVSEPVRDLLQKRIETFSDLRNDGSFQDRSNGYEQMAVYVKSNPLGVGLGAMDTVLGGKSDLGTRDSGILDFIISLGWIGAAIYFFSLALVIWSGIPRSAERSRFEIAAGAVSIAMVCHMALATISSGFSAVVLWSFAGITLSVQKSGNQAPADRQTLHF